MQKDKLERTLELAPGGLTGLSYVLMQSIAVGGTPDTIANGLKVDKTEIEKLIEELNQDGQLFDRGVAILRVDSAGGVFDRDFGWDDLERIVLKKLQAVINSIRDPDVLTRVAVAANRAKRSTDAPVHTGIRAESGSTVILAGGDLGQIQLNLSHRVARQLAAPETAPRLMGDDPPSEGNRRGIEMLKLADIRQIAEDLPADDGESVVQEKQRIRVDSSMLDEILGRDGHQ